MQTKNKIYFVYVVCWVVCDVGVGVGVGSGVLCVLSVECPRVVPSVVGRGSPIPPILDPPPHTKIFRLPQ